MKKIIKQKRFLLSILIVISIISTIVVLGNMKKPDNANVPLKEAKLIIEHNATAKDTGFQGFLDSEGWKNLTVTGPKGKILAFKGEGKLGSLGLTELFFETVEPENAEVSIEEMLKKLPEGKYIFKGTDMEGEETSGIATFTHNIPNGAELLTPKEGEKIPIGDLIVSWAPVTETIDGKKVNIIAYELIIQKDTEPHNNFIGKRGFEMYLPSDVTSIKIDKVFFEPNTKYNWEVLAIEESGNQTLSSSEFYIK